MNWKLILWPNKILWFTLSLAPLDFTHTADRVRVVQPGLGFRQQNTVLFYSRNSHEYLPWNAILQVFRPTFWICLGLFITIFCVILTWSGKSCSLQSAKLAHISVLKAVVSQPFDHQAFLKVIPKSYNSLRLLKEVKLKVSK